MNSKHNIFAIILGIIGLLTAIVTNIDKISDKLFPPKVALGPPPPPITGTWTWYSSHDPKVLENILELAHVDPARVAANCTTSGDIHIWYQPNTGNAKFSFREVPWTAEKHPTNNFFHADGNIVPIGWRQRTGKYFAYFAVTR